MDNLLFVVCHKPYSIPKDAPYKSIAVGYNKDQLVTDWRDDSGDNIADKNSSYCELTAQYWIWKNVGQQYNNIGLCHYRRYFACSSLNRSKIINNDAIDKYLKKADIIMPSKWYWDEGVYRKYFENGNGKEKDLVTAREVLKDLYPAYVQAFDTVMHGKGASYCNMFITGRTLFEQYNTWLFEVLGEIEKRTDISSYTAAEARIFGYLSELLLNVWVLKNNLRVKYLPLIELEGKPKNMVLAEIRSRLRMN